MWPSPISDSHDFSSAPRERDICGQSLGLDAGHASATVRISESGASERLEKLNYSSLAPSSFRWFGAQCGQGDCGWTRKLSTLGARAGGVGPLDSQC
jgi:hypothetical protein